jgi:hypothetical protein
MRRTLPAVDQGEALSEPRRQPIGQALLHIQSWLTGHEDDFTRWCDAVHHSEALAAPGFLACRRFELVPGYAYGAPNGASFLTMYQLADQNAFETDAHRAVVERMTPAPPGVMEAVTYTSTIYRERYPESGWPENGWMAPDGTVEAGAEPMGQAILHVMMDVEAAWDGELNAWYAEEHLPRLLEVPGMLAGRRFVDANWPATGASAADGRHQYLAVYELADADVVTTPDYAKAAEMSPRTAELAPHLSFFSQVYREVFAAASAERGMEVSRPTGQVASE